MYRTLEHGIEALRHVWRRSSGATVGLLSVERHGGVRRRGDGGVIECDQRRWSVAETAASMARRELRVKVASFGVSNVDVVEVDSKWPTTCAAPSH